jgi:hypothetical protein
LNEIDEKNFLKTDRNQSSVLLAINGWISQTQFAKCILKALKNISTQIIKEADISFNQIKRLKTYSSISPSNLDK